MSQIDWDKFYIKQAQEWANKSKDRSTKVGVVIVGPDHEPVTAGYNGFPRGVDDNVECRHDRPDKYMWTEHAERNALYNALRTGVSVKGCTMYMNFMPTPCHDCARGVIQAGISEIVGPDIPFPGRGDMWVASLKVSEQMLEESGVKRRIITLA